jgi:molecular chaperone DnaK (HSP70)
MGIDERIFVGIDIGTSTCQAYGGKWMQRIEPELEEEEESSNYPSTIFQTDDGYSYGFEAQRRATTETGRVHEHYKAYMRPKHSLPERYSIQQAINLFVLAGENFSRLILPTAMQEVDDEAQSIRVDLAWTLPAGWQGDPKAATVYRQQIATLKEKIELSHPNCNIHPYLVEEPVAALLSLKNRLKSLPVGKPVLVIDAGGGTLDIAVCSCTKNGSNIDLAVQYTDSISHAGAAVFHCFVDTLIAQNACKPPLPKDWKKHSDIYVGLKDIFHNHHKKGNSKRKWTILRQDSSDVKVTFSAQKVNEAMSISTLFKRQKKFLEVVFQKYVEYTKSKETNFAKVYGVGGLMAYPLFKAFLQAEFSEIEVMKSPSQAVAIGAALYAKECGKQIDSRRVPYDLCERMVEPVTGRYIFVPIIQRGMEISADEEKVFRKSGYAQHKNNRLHIYLAFANGQEMNDEIHTLYDDYIIYRDGFEAGDEFITELRFDNLLRVVMRHIHVKTEAAINISEKMTW